MGRRWRIAVLVLMLLVGAGCAMGEVLADPGDPVDLTPDTLAGTWLSGTSRSLEFTVDGTFTAVNLPVELFQDYLNKEHIAPGQPVNGTGTWSFKPGGSSSAIVHLEFTELAGVPTTYGGQELDALRPADGRVYLVFFYIGEGGNSWTGYHKPA